MVGDSVYVTDSDFSGPAVLVSLTKYANLRGISLPEVGPKDRIFLHFPDGRAIPLRALGPNPVIRPATPEEKMTLERLV